LSFFATAGVISRVGARPVFADIEEDSLNLDPRLAEAACTSRTRAVIPVHLYGRAAAMPRVDVPVIEDSAQSIGAAAVTGACAALSFFPAKNLGALGDAGAVLTHDHDLAERMRVLRVHGARPKYFHDLIGGNFRLDAMQAAALRVKLPHLAAWTDARRQNAARYRDLFAAARIPAELRLPGHTAEHVYNQFVIRAPRRDALRDHLAGAGIATAVYYPVPLHLQRCYAELGHARGSFPVAEKASAEVLALPVYPSLSADQQAHVVDRIAAFYAGP
jgi:dTDP-4-amino-4,6-dideoxygalactose transaminase